MFDVPFPQLSTLSLTVCSQNVMLVISNFVYIFFARKILFTCLLCDHEHIIYVSIGVWKFEPTTVRFLRRPLLTKQVTCIQAWLRRFAQPSIHIRTHLHGQTHTHTCTRPIFHFPNIRATAAMTTPASSEIERPKDQPHVNLNVASPSTAAMSTTASSDAAHSEHKTHANSKDAICNDSIRNYKDLDIVIPLMDPKDPALKRLLRSFEQGGLLDARRCWERVRDC